MPSMLYCHYDHLFYRATSLCARPQCAGKAGGLATEVFWDPGDLSPATAATWGAHRRSAEECRLQRRRGRKSSTNWCLGEERSPTFVFVSLVILSRLRGLTEQWLNTLTYKTMTARSMYVCALLVCFDRANRLHRWATDVFSFAAPRCCLTMRAQQFQTVQSLWTAFLLGWRPSLLLRPSIHANTT